jgi:hypothetical protein
LRAFISYRRDDAQDFAGRLADRVRAAPGVDQVFLDVDGIHPGEDFEARLKTALAQADVSLIVIGRDWRGVREDGRARLDEPGDFVRLEVAQALRGGGRVIPVLANGAVMPGPGALPDDLADLAKRNAVSVRHTDFDRDVDHLLDILFARRPLGRRAAYFARHPVQAGLLKAAGGATAAFIALVVVAAIHLSMTGRSLDEAIGGPGPTEILIGLVLVGGGLAPVLFGRFARRA